MDDERIEIPAAWESLNLKGVRGNILVLGEVDVGKSTFARYLHRRLQAELGPVALLDADPGQTSLGPPATQSLAFDPERVADGAPVRRYFVGANSPRGHMLPAVVGVARLAGLAHRQGAQAVVIDTSGLVDPAQGGLTLKLAKIELLQPGLIVAIQRDAELEPVLMPLRRGRQRLATLRPARLAHRRSTERRQAHRAGQYARHFAGARPLAVPWGHLAVFPYPRFRGQRLVGLDDADGFCLGLGIVLEIDRAGRQVSLLTALRSLDGVAALRLGDLLLDPETFVERPVSGV